MIWRIRDRASFAALRNQGVRARAGSIGVAYLPRPEHEPPRVGYAISRRVGTAVERNRLRRRFRASLAELTRRDPATLRGGLFLFSPAAEATRLSAPELTQSVSTVIDKVRRRAGTARGAR